MIESTYHPDWQNNRIKFILSKYPESFFKGKSILELGPYNGYIGAYFQSIGATVHSVEGRMDNVYSIREKYPDLSVECTDLDTQEWLWGDYDIIINFGLYYHLQNHHKEHLINCTKHCKLMFFETVIYDSSDPEIYFKHEDGADQSMSLIGGTPTTSYIENLLSSEKVEFEKFSDSSLNGNGHYYDWPDTNSKIYSGWSRRFWIVDVNKQLI
jgi:hypothetical protein